MPFAVAEDAVGALGWCAAYPPLGMTVCGAAPVAGVLATAAPSLAKIWFEDAGERGVAVLDQEAEGGDPAAEVYQQGARLLAGPGAGRWAVTPEDGHVPVLTSMRNSTYRRLRKIVPAWKKSQASSPSAGVRGNARQQVSILRGAGLHRPGAQDRPRGRLADAVTESAYLAVDPAVSPGRALVRRSQHQVADVRAGARAPPPVRVGPFACDQAAVPGQQRCACRESRPWL